MNGTRGYVIIAVVVIALVSLVNRCVSVDLSQRHQEIFTEMVYSKAYESFTASPDLPGGVTQQQLVSGVVPRGFELFPYGEGAEEARRAGAELANPFSADDAKAVTRGRELYAIYCTVCHDSAGNGQGQAVLHGMLPPPSLHADRAKQLADGELFHILTKGQGNMASYASQITPEERWKVILHLRKLQGGS